MKIGLFCTASVERFMVSWFCRLVTILPENTTARLAPGRFPVGAKDRSGLDDFYCRLLALALIDIKPVMSRCRALLTRE